MGIICIYGYYSVLYSIILYYQHYKLKKNKSKIKIYSYSIMEKLEQAIKSQRNISARSLSTYLRNLRLLNKKLTKNINVSFENLDFLKDFKTVKNELEQKTPSTRKNVLASILVGLKALKYPEKVIEKYSKYLFDVALDYDNKMKEQKKNFKQSENWTTMKGLQDVLNYYASKLRRKGYIKKTKLTTKEKDNLQRYLVLSLYLIDPKNPPRRLDYADMKIIRSDENVPNNKLNYLKIYSRNKKEFIFNKYKTSKKYGKQIIPLSSKLNSVVNLYLKFNPDSEYLLQNARGSKMSENSLGKYITKIFQDRIGKKISANMIRHIFLSEEYKDVPKLKELESMSEKMGHSVSEAMKTYVKK